MWEGGKVERRFCRFWEGVVKGEEVFLLLVLPLGGGGLVEDEGGRFALRDLEGLAILEAGCVVTAGTSVCMRWKGVLFCIRRTLGLHGRRLRAAAFRAFRHLALATLTLST